MFKMIIIERPKLGYFLWSVIISVFLLIDLHLMDFAGFNIPSFLIQFCGFICIAFFPGLIILGILKFDKLSISECGLYSVGLSCFFLMFIGLIINNLYPILGISKPLSIEPLAITVLIAFFLLYSICCKINPLYVPFVLGNSTFKGINSPYMIIMLLLPILSVIGAFLVCFHNSNIVLLILIFIISMVPILVAYNKINEKYYALTIFLISISLLYHNSLSSLFLQGSDLHLEYYFANIVFLNCKWDPTIEANTNALIVDTLLAPILARLLFIDLAWIFKIVYPFIYSLIPLGLYTIYRNYNSSRIAFFSCFFFVSFIGYYTSILVHGKQMIAEFFFVLIFLSAYCIATGIKQKFLMLVFSMSLVASHYAISYIFIFILVFSIIIFYISICVGIRIQEGKNLIRINYITFFAIFALSWYLYLAGSNSLKDMALVWQHVISSIFSSFFNPVEGGVMYWVNRELTLSWEITKLLTYIYQVFIFLGLFSLFIKKMQNKKVTNTSGEFMLFAIACFILLLAGILLPSLIGRGSISFGRLFSFVLIMISPFGVIGIKNLIEYLIKSTNFVSNLDFKFSKRSMFRYFSLYFSIYLLFSSSLIPELIQEINGNEYSTSMSISKPRIEINGTTEEKITYYGDVCREEDVLSAYWIGKFRQKGTNIFVDGQESSQILTSYGMIYENIYPLRPPLGLDKITNNYIYLRKINYIDNILCIDYWTRQELKIDNEWWPTSDILPKFNMDKNRVYFNGASIIYQ